MKTSWIMMQPSTTMIKIMVFHNYSVFDEPHFLKKLRGKLGVFLLINVWWVDIYCTLAICLTCTRCIRERQRKVNIYSMKIDSAERLAFSFVYRNTQFRTKTQSTFRMRKVDSSLLVRLHWSIKVALKHSKYLMHVKHAYVVRLVIHRQ